MVMTDVIYDVVSGVVGTIFGVVVTLLATARRTRQTNDLLITTQQKVDALGEENIRLIGALRERENRILELEQKILQAEAKKVVKQKKRGK